MAIGNCLGCPSLNYGAYGLAHGQRTQMAERQAVTLEAQRDPQTPYQYSVTIKKEIIPAAEPATNIKNNDNNLFRNKLPDNTDPISRAFLNVANYRPDHHTIDIEV